MDDILKTIGLPEVFSHQFFTQLLSVEQDKYDNLQVEINNEFDLVDSLTDRHTLLRNKKRTSIYTAIRISSTKVKIDFDNLELHQILESIGPNLLFQTSFIQKLLLYKQKTLQKYGLFTVALYLFYLIAIILWPKWFVILPFFG